MKTCPKCNAVMNDENTRRKRSEKQKGEFVSYCNSCYTIDSRLRLQASPEGQARKKLQDGQKRDRFQALIRGLKSERPCYDCGNVFPPEGMDFDHISGKKKFQIAQGYHKPWDEVRREIDKCQLVCAVCHRIRTLSRNKEVNL